MEPIDIVGARFFESTDRYSLAPDLTDGDIVILDKLGVFEVKITPAEPYYLPPCDECDCYEPILRHCKNRHFLCRVGDYRYRKLKRVGDGTN